MQYYYRINKEGSVSYLCLVCRNEFKSHQSISYHLFKANEPCINNLNVGRIPEPDNIIEFEGERMSVPTSVVDKDSHPEHRDAQGRLRISGMITGYRGWTIGRVDNQFRIFPVFKRWSMPYSKGVMTADCHALENSIKHSVPDLECTCGFYASWSSKKVKEFTTSNNILIKGRLKAFGKVLPGELGWRAQNVMVDGFYQTVCGVYQCDNKATKYIVRPNWYNPVSSKGQVYPRINSSEYKTYRDVADFSASTGISQYLGWYCDQHEFTEFVEPMSDYICNFPKTTQLNKRSYCKRPSTFALKGLPYSWCHEHAPFIFEADEVLSSLCNYYDVYLIEEEI